MRVNAAFGSIQSTAGLQQQTALIPIGMLDGQAHDFQRRGFGVASQLHIGKQRPVTTKTAPGAERVG